MHLFAEKREVLHDAARFIVRHGGSRHDGEQSSLVILRKHQLVASQAVVVVVVEEVVLPQRRYLEVSEEISFVGVALKIVGQGGNHQRERRHALLTVNQEDARDARCRAFRLGDVEHRAHEMRRVVAACSHDVIPEHCALLHAPRVNSLVHGDDELHLCHAHEVEQVRFVCLHLRLPSSVLSISCVVSLHAVVDLLRSSGKAARIESLPYWP